jgi:hypothetical protein
MGFVKRHLAVALAGLVIVGGASYVGAAEMSSRTPPASDDEVVLAQDAQGTQDAQEQSDEQETPGDRPGRPHSGFPGAIRGELTVHARDGDGFADVRFDRGILDRVDGTTIVITEDDGTTVEIPTTDDTRIGRDGEKATLEDLQAGDHVSAFRVDEGDGFVTKGVRAVSPERWAEYEAKREECREQPVRCRHQMRRHVRGGRNGDAV